jgi:hypothetical protein
MSPRRQAYARHRAFLPFIISLLAWWAPPAEAQWRHSPSWETRASQPLTPVSILHETLPDRSGDRAASLGKLVAGGAAAGALGMLLGAAFTPSEAGFDYRVASLSTSLSVPVGVHLANRAHGNLLLAELASAGIGAAVVFGRLVGPGNRSVLLLAVPATGLAAAVAIETLTGKVGRTP